MYMHVRGLQTMASQYRLTLTMFHSELFPKSCVNGSALPETVMTSSSGMCCAEKLEASLCNEW